MEENKKFLEDESPNLKIFQTHIKSFSYFLKRLKLCCLKHPFKTLFGGQF